MRYTERVAARVSGDRYPASYSFRHHLVWPGCPTLPECSRDQARAAHRKKSPEPGNEINWVCNGGGGGEPINHLCNLWTSSSIR